MNIKTKEFVQKMIKVYYDSVTVKPREIGAREVGYGTLEQKIAVRHLWFKNDDEFNDFLRNKSPFYVSASSAYYDKPDARPMSNKGWLGADLVFDLDLHPEEWDPNNEFKEYHSLMHPVAFDKVKQMAVKLVEDFLIPDFGFSKDELSINFSGNRGYHIRIYNDKIKMLTSKERREIADYITGNGLEFDKFFEVEHKRLKDKGKPLTIIKKGPKPEDYGWRGRIARLLMSQEPGSEILPKELKSKNKLSKFKEGVKLGQWDKVKISNKEDVWKQLVKYSAVAIGEQTDVNVTIDTARLLRVPNTIHGSSSLAAKEFDYKFVDKFNPLRHAVVFTDKKEINVNIIKEVPEFMIKGKQYEQLGKGTVSLPLCYAIYLMTKGYAEAV